MKWLILLSIFFFNASYAEIRLTTPSHVCAGVKYQVIYSDEGGWGSSTSFYELNVHITGGNIDGNNTIKLRVSAQKPNGLFNVVWNGGYGSLSYYWSPYGERSVTVFASVFSVNITPAIGYVVPGQQIELSSSINSGIANSYTWSCDKPICNLNSSTLSTVIANPSVNTVYTVNATQVFTRAGNPTITCSAISTATVKISVPITGNSISFGTSSIDGLKPGGGDGINYTYSWQSSSDNVNWISLASANGQNYTTFLPPTTLTYYRRLVVSPGTLQSVSNTITVNSLRGNTIGITVSGTNLNLTTSTVSGGNGIYTYKWQKFYNNVWSDVATTSGYSTTAPLFSTSYRRIVSSVGAFDSYSNETYFEVPISNNTITKYQDLPFDLRGSQPVGGSSGTYHYQWQSAPLVGIDWTDIKGAKGKDLLFTNLPQEPKKYRRIIGLVFYLQSGAVAETLKIAEFLESNYVTVGELTGGEIKYCGEAFSALKIKMFIGASSGIPAIRWYSSTDGINFSMEVDTWAWTNWTPPVSTNNKMFYRAQIQFNSEILTTNIVTKERGILPASGFITKGMGSTPQGLAINEFKVGSLGTLDPFDFLDSDIKWDRGDLLTKATTVSIGNFSSDERFYFEANSAQPCGASSNREGDEIQVIADEASFLETALNVYPNPSNGTLFFTSNSKDVIENVKVMSLLGEKVYESTNSISGESSIKLNVANGTYFVLATMNGKVFKKQIVIQNDGF